MNRSLQETGNPAKIRQLNKKAILSYVRTAQVTNRSEMGRELKLAPATVTAVVADLLEDRLLIETAPDQDIQQKRSRGRPLKVLKLNPNAYFTIGISLRLEHDMLFIDSSFSNYCSEVTCGKTLQCESPLSIDSVFESISEAITSLTKLIPESSTAISLGLGVPGVVRNEEILFSPYLTFLEGDELYKRLASRFNGSVYLENDASLLVVRELEKREELRSLNASYLLISQGLGSATTNAGKLWRASAWSGEIGQIDLPFENGELMRLERIIGVDGYLANQLVELGVNIDRDCPLTSEELENKAISELLDQYASYLYLAVQILNSTFGLDVIVIGSKYKFIIEQFMPRLLSLIDNSPLKVRLIYTSQVQNAAVEGAALLALKNSIDDRYRK